MSNTLSPCIDSVNHAEAEAEAEAEKRFQNHFLVKEGFALFGVVSAHLG